MSNQFKFVCPLFGTETKIAACYQVKDHVQLSKPLDVRRGCQAAIRSCKCPVDALIMIERTGQLTRADYDSADPVLGKLEAKILDRIRPIIVQEHHLNRYGVPPAERNALTEANDRIDKMRGSAPQQQPARRKSVAKPSASPVREAPGPHQTKKAPAELASTINQAAATGNLAAALNQ